MFSDVTSKISDVNPVAFNTTDPVISALYNVANLSNLSEYSALHYQQAEVNLGCTYNFTPALYTTAQAGVKIFTDPSSTYNPYGDQSGTVYSGTLGLGYKF